MITVAVEVPPQSSQELAQAAIDGCDGALGKGRCGLAGSAAAADRRFHARVSVHDREPSVVSVELRERDGSGRLLEIRRLRFSHRDTELERSSSVGVVIAALVAAQQRAEPQPQPQPPPEADQPQRPPEPLPRTAARRVYRLRVDLGATVNRALDEDPIQLGGALRVSGMREPWPVFVIVSGAYETRLQDQPDVSWWDLTLGAGVRIGSNDAPLAAELRAEAVAEHVSVQAFDDDSGSSEAAGRWRFGPRLGLDAIWTFSSRLGLVVGAEASLLRPAVVIDLHDRTVEQAPAVGWGSFWGLRLAP
jgi:hypothetical protein